MRRRAVDTNILVRALVDDGSEQSERAARLLVDGTIHVSATVILEAEWVLRSRFGVGRTSLSALFADLLRLPQLHVEARDAIVGALASFDRGLDFADALHLHLAGGCDEFLTFDRDFVRKARSIEGVPTVREL